MTESVESFSTSKVGRAYVVRVMNLHPNEEDVTFQFDSGASMSLIGLNTVCDDENEQAILGEIVREEIKRKAVRSHPGKPETVTREHIEVFPCRMDGVSISGTNPITFYFHIFLGKIGMPLLGFDYIDGCSCQHSIGGEFIISAVENDVGKKYYPKDIIDFNDVLKELSKRI